MSIAKRHGGVDVRVLQTAREFARRGVAFRVAVMAGSSLHEALKAENLPAEPIARGRGDPRIALDLIRIARDMDANVIDGHNMQSQYWAVVASLGRRFPGRVATVHSIYREEHPRPGKRELREGALWLSHWLGFRFIAVSTRVERYLTGTIGVAPERITLSWNGMEPLGPLPPRYDLGAETGWPKDTFVLGMIGRLEPVKGHRTLFDAMARLVAAGERRMRLVIVGTGRDGAALEQIVRERGLAEYVHFAGFRSDVTAVLEELDLMCLPSISEGLPFCVLEACRQGVPVLASELDGMSDLFTDDGTIFFTPSGDAARLAERLAKLIDDRDTLHRVGTAAKGFVETELGIGTMIDTTLAAYAGAMRR
ncbi:glycosyltransferase family 4 protein [Sinisalibacter aestuarii]|uniref:glycosyltransferase family 4 protein n=1 Tax=Sinisalibacter aestuarii TaxID=2949426 RepID=UPI00248F9EB8|nr:glycosyltransferase family 4 protein [Sinisalibacter aestuarii]